MFLEENIKNLRQYLANNSVLILFLSFSSPPLLSTKINMYEKFLWVSLKFINFHGKI